MHGGQIQPVTTHLRVNIREFILSIKQYGGHLSFSHFTHLLYKWAQWAYAAHGPKMIMTLILFWTTFVLRKAKLGLQLAR